MLDHFLRHVEIGDDPLAQWPDRLDAARGTAEHQLRFFADRENLPPALDAGNGDDRGAQQPQRHDRVHCPPLPDDEGGRQQQHGADQGHDRSRGPRVAAPTPQAGQQQRAGSPREQRGAHDVERLLRTVGSGCPESAAQGRQGDGSHRDVEVEDPAPAGVVDHQPAEQRADRRGDGEGGGDVALVTATLTWRDQVADRGHGQRHETAGGRALDAPQDDQLGHVLRQAAQRRGSDECRQGDLDQTLVAVPIAELAPQRRGGGRRHDVHAHQPRHVAQVAEVAGDGRQTGGEDGLVEDGGEHGQDQGGEPHPHPARRPRPRAGHLQLRVPSHRSPPAFVDLSGGFSSTTTTLRHNRSNCLRIEATARDLELFPPDTW